MWTAQTGQPYKRLYTTPATGRNGCKHVSSARHEFDGKASVFLDANENAFGSPTKPGETMDVNFNRYPDPLQWQLKFQLARIKGVPAENIFIGNVNASSPFYERRRLLIQENVQAIAVDGGNRKWIGTSNALYLFGDDGDELIGIFNTKNSPLASNNIQGIEILDSGEVFILTKNGLISYKSDASDVNVAFKEPLIYPNPVRPEFNGVLTISDLTDNTDVKITDLAGNLIYETISNGGTATWDLKFQGTRVASGIYLVLCTNEDETQNLVANLLLFAKQLHQYLVFK